MMSLISSFHPLKLVAVTGSAQTPSKTEALVDAILAELQQHIDIELKYVKLSEIGHLVNGATRRDLLATEVQQALDLIETADALIVASPVYRASYTGLFKHLFDYVDQFALVDKPVLLAASGGSERHALMLDHQFRPLFSFFQAQILPIGVFATDKDFENYQIVDQLLIERIKLAVSRSIPQLLFASNLAFSSKDQAEKDIKLNQYISDNRTLFFKHIPNLKVTQKVG